MNRAMLAVPVVLALASFASGAESPTFRLTLADFGHRDVHLKSVDAAEAVVIDATTQAERRLPLADVVELRRAPAKRAVDGWFALATRDGQRIICRPTAIRDDQIVCATQMLGERKYPIADVASIDLAASPETAAVVAAQQDELRLANGDRLHGVVSGADSKTLTCQAADGQPVAIDWTNVRQIRFAETQVSPAIPAEFRVTLTGGTRVLATAFATDGTSATLAVAGGDVHLPLGDVATVEHTEGEAMMLAWRTPSLATYEPFFPSAMPTQASFTIDPSIASIHGGTTALSVRPRSVLQWSVEPSYRRFHARCVVPVGRPFADVTIRVHDGERVAFERTSLKSGESAVEIDVPISSSTVSMQTDYGDDFDVQDQAVWLDAAVLKSDAIEVSK